MRRIFYDFEFLEDGERIHPLSLGMVDHQGATYEAVFYDAPWDEVGRDPWLMDNVVPHLPVHTRPPRSTPTGTRTTVTPDTTDPRVKPAWVIANEVRAFITQGGGDDPTPVELWGDHPAYDHVCLAQLWGRMVDLPAGVPMLTHCVTQLAAFLGATVPDQPDGVHDAMADAHHIRTVYDYLTLMGKPQRWIVGTNPDNQNNGALLEQRDIIWTNNNT